MTTKLLDKSNQDDLTKDNPLISLTKGLKFLNYAYSVERVRTSHFVFSSDVEDFKLKNLSDFGRAVIRNYLHVGIVSDACEKPYKQYEVLLVHWPPNIPRSVYDDKSRARLCDKVRTIIFSVPEKQLNKYVQSRDKISMDDIIASTAILTEADDWRLMESKVMNSFFNIVDTAYLHVSEGRDAWKTYPADCLNTQWKQMLFLCCFNYDVGYHLNKMTTRNWTRISRRMIADEQYSSSKHLIDSEVPKGGIYDLLVLWSRHPALHRDMIEFLKNVNEEKSYLLPLDILEKLKYALVGILFVTKRFPCELCSYASHWKSELKIHMRKHTGEKPFKCELCAFEATISTTMKRHIRAHKGIESFQCEYCGRSFVVRFSLKYHLVSKHHAKGNFIYRCYSCKSQYENVNLLREHVFTHANDKKFQCNTCLRRFITESDLEKHMANHSDEKPFDCHICGKKFLRKSTLVTHYRVHSDKTYMCGFCGKATNHELSKRMHELHMHNSFESRAGVIEINAKELGKAI